MALKCMFHQNVFVYGIKLCHRFTYNVFPIILNSLESSCGMLFLFALPLYQFYVLVLVFI